MKYYHALFAAGLFVYGCTTSEEAQKAAKPAEDEVTIASVIKPLDFAEQAAVYTVNANAADTIFAPSGSTILFEANTFVDSKGKPIKGKVNVEWQEFHTLAEIMASGIPMKYDSAGVAHDLESGGMFTIAANYKGKPAEIAPGKEVEVNLASIQDTPCYNFYELDEESGDWSYQTTKEGDKVEEESSDVADNTSKKTSGTIFEMDLNTHEYPELANEDIIGWEAKKTLNAKERGWIRQVDTKVRIAKKNADGSYQLEAKTDESTKRYDVIPFTEDMAEASSAASAVALDASVAEITEYQENVAAGRVIRSISITGFGTYNWDIINYRENSLPLFAEFNYPDDVNPDLVTLYLVSPDENIIVVYDSKSEKMFSFDPNSRNMLIGILPNNELVSAPDSEFNTARGKRSGAQHSFELRKTGLKLKSPKDMEKYMNQLI